MSIDSFPFQLSYLLPPEVLSEINLTDVSEQQVNQALQLTDALVASGLPIQDLITEVSQLWRALPTNTIIEDHH